MTTDDILDLRRRVEALEARAAAEESSAPAPAADRPLAELMRQVWRDTNPPLFGYADEIDAVAEWLDARGCMDAGDLLRAEAQRAREGA